MGRARTPRQGDRALRGDAPAKPHHRPPERVSDQQVGLGVPVVVVVLVLRRLVDLAPERPRIDGRHATGELGMTVRISDRHLRVEDAQELVGHRSAAEPDGADDDRQVRHVELSPDVLDQVDEMLLVLGDRLVGAAVLVSLEPDEARDLVALALVARNDLADARQRVAHSLHHQPILGRLELVVGSRAATRRRPEVEPERPVALRGLDQQDLRIVELSEHVAESEFGSDRLAVRSRGQR